MGNCVRLLSWREGCLYDLAGSEFALEHSLDESSQSSAMSICSSDAIPVSQTSSSQKTTCLKRKKKSRSRAPENESCEFDWLNSTSDERDDEITKRLNFDDLELSDNIDEVEEKTESAKKRRASIKEGAHPSSDTKSRRSSVVQPIRNTCILESPMHPRKSNRKRRIYGVRRNGTAMLVATHC
jgi:hypothetical protein